VASGFWFNVGFQSSVVINVNADGTVALVEGSTDIGGTRASIAMQAAETLGIPYEDVRPTVVGTDGIGFTDVTGGSRTTFATGYAAHEAALDVLRQMKERLARRWDGEMEKEFEGQAEREMARITPDDMTYTNGVFKCAKDANKTMTFKEIAAQMARMGGPITGRATSQPRGVGGAFATHIVDVEVDPDTGKVTIFATPLSRMWGEPSTPAMQKARSRVGPSRVLVGLSTKSLSTTITATWSIRASSIIVCRRPWTCR